jgi:predicted RNA binding protein YcfA (HicA-like mRNA interferase family)
MFSGHEVVDKLEKLGFSKIRQKGSHVIMKKCVKSVTKTSLEEGVFL